MNYRNEILLLQPNKDKRLATKYAFSRQAASIPNTSLESIESPSMVRLALLQRQTKPYTATILTKEALDSMTDLMINVARYQPTATRVIVAPKNFSWEPYGGVKPHFLIKSDSTEEQNEKLVEALTDIARRRQIMVVGSQMREISLAGDIACSVQNLQERVNLTLGHTEKRVGEFIDNVPRRYFVVADLDLKDRSGDHDVLAYLVHRGVKKSHIFAYGQDDALQKRATELGIKHMLPAPDRPSEELLNAIRRVRDKEKRH